MMKKIELVFCLFLGFFLLSFHGQIIADEVKVSGKVMDTKQRPVEGVVVNDGFNFTLTDKNGMYTLVVDDARSRYVSISVPAAYEIPVNASNLICFYRPIKKEVVEGDYDFVLEKREKPTKKFSYLVFSDPQPKDDFHFVRFFTETVPDVRQFVADMEGEVYGFVEGDIVSDALHLYPLYVSAVASWGIPMMHVIGNHDFDKRYAAADRVGNLQQGYGEKIYESYFGPTDYSLNIGDVHIICMKDIDYVGDKKYRTLFTDAQLAWLQKDLSFVKPGSTVFLNVHAPIFNVIKTGNSKKVLDLFKDYNVHIFSGHTHFHQNQVLADNIYEHNVGPVCGFHWQGNASRCGAPNGYMCVTVDNKNIQWKFKATGHDWNYQFKVYKPGKFDSQAEFVVANVWDWDETFQVRWYEDGVLKGNMEQFLDIDQDFLDSGRVKVYRTNHLFRAKPSSTAKTVKIEVVNRFGEIFTKTINL